MTSVCPLQVPAPASIWELGTERLGSGWHCGGSGAPPGASPQRQAALGPPARLGWPSVSSPVRGAVSAVSLPETQSHWECAVSPLSEGSASPPRPAGADALVAGESGVQLCEDLWQQHYLLFSCRLGTSRPARWSPIASGLFNLDLFLLSRHIVTIALIPRSRCLRTSPPKAQRRRRQYPPVLSLRWKLSLPQHFTSLHESFGNLNDMWLSL